MESSRNHWSDRLGVVMGQADNDDKHQEAYYQVIHAGLVRSTVADYKPSTFQHRVALRPTRFTAQRHDRYVRDSGGRVRRLQLPDASISRPSRPNVEWRASTSSP